LESWFSNLWKTDTFSSMHEGQKADMRGLIVPVLTPFKDSGEIDRDAFARHLEYLADHGVHRIMVNGTTGEFHSMLPRERKLVLKLARRHFQGFIVFHAGGTGLTQNRIEVRWANRFGADAVAVLPPSYPAGLSEAGIIEYFRALEAEAEVPFILYNFPRHCGNAITPEILKAVPHYALKDSAKNVELMEHTPRYFIGTSSDISEPVQQGASGFIAAAANVRPELYSAFEALLASARSEEAAVMQEEVRAYSAQFSAGGVPALKQALARLLPGYPSRVRIPLCAQPLL
jgi:4-hydroxy-tetrahydrodipicolinate synthase